MNLWRYFILSVKTIIAGTVIVFCLTIMGQQLDPVKLNIIKWSIIVLFAIVLADELFRKEIK